MTKQEMLSVVQSQLATDLNCTPGDLNGEKDSFLFTDVLAVLAKNDGYIVGMAGASADCAKM